MKYINFVYNKIVHVLAFHK